MRYTLELVKMRPLYKLRHVSGNFFFKLTGSANAP